MFKDFNKKENIIKALRFQGHIQKDLFKYAQQVRDIIFSKKVEVRSVIEYSNICQQACNYCGMNKFSGLKRYILGDNELLKHVKKLYSIGRRVIMFQTGESSSNSYFNNLYRLLKEVKDTYSDLTVICCFGNLSKDKYKRLRDIGIERYLLKFETSDSRLYRKIKPFDDLNNRLAHIRMLKKLGFHVSSGNITGLPGQTLSILADDLLLLKELDIPMGSTSVFIPNDMSNYAHYPPGDINLVLNFMAILRIMCPAMLIPTTSSLELLVKDGQRLGLMAGANTVTLHDGTPKKEEDKFVIYKKARYTPKDVLFKIVKRADLKCYQTSLVRDKIQNTLFYKFINKNLKSKKTAVYFENRKYTYDDLFVLTSKFCSFLQDNNINEGQVVLLAVFDSIEFVVAFLSCIRLGIIVAPVDPQMNEDEWNLILSSSSPNRILATECVYKKLKDKRVLKITDDNSSKYFFSILERLPQSDIFARTDKNNPAMILYTSGTTGKPKGVIHTYKNLFVDNFPRTILKMSAKDTIYSCSRIYTSFGLGNSLLFPFHFGASVILTRNIPNPFSLKKILALKPSLFFAVPSIYELLLDYKDDLREAFKCVRLFICSGEKLYSDIFKQWESIYQLKLLECFGSSEMCHSFISNFPGKEKINSCGKIIEGFKIKFSKNGHIFYKGPSLSPGYYADKRLTEEKMVHGWFKSDDIGYRDKKGYIFFKGRKNLVFKSDGKWISALDIEDKLRKYQLISKIAVIKGQKGIDYYVSLNRKSDIQNAEKKIRRYCMNNLKIHEFPETINILDEIPETKSGKINRKYLECQKC